jgi:hypothetical protein
MAVRLLTQDMLINVTFLKPSVYHYLLSTTKNLT